MRKILVIGVAVAAALALAGVAWAQNGHFIHSQTCTDIGTQVRCTGTVAGLGSTKTFRVTVTANGVATVECKNKGGNVAPGQSFSFTTSGTTGNQPVPANGSTDYTVTTQQPSAPAGSCPNGGWTATVTDVTFTSATLTLFEGNTQSDQVTVPVN